MLSNGGEGTNRTKVPKFHTNYANHSADKTSIFVNQKNYISQKNTTDCHFYVCHFRAVCNNGES